MGALALEERFTVLAWSPQRFHGYLFVDPNLVYFHISYLHLRTLRYLLLEIVWAWPGLQWLKQTGVLLIIHASPSPTSRVRVLDFVLYVLSRGSVRVNNS